MIKVINRKKNRFGSESLRGKKKSSGKWLFRLVVVFFVVTLAYALFFSDLLAVTDVKISGLNKLDETSIRDSVDEKLNGKYLGFIRKNNLILALKSEIQEILLANFKRIEAVRIEKVFPNRLIVVIKERNLTMLLCSSGKCYVLNERGEAYPADNFNPEELEAENLVTLDDSGGSQVNTENNPLESSFQDFILKLGDRVLSDTEIVLKKHYETPSRMSGDLKAETEEGWRINFSQDIGLEKELLMLKTVLINKIPKDQQKDLEYVDLRIANKVFYKFKDGAEQAQEQTSENVPVQAPEVKKDEKKDKKKN